MQSSRKNNSQESDKRTRAPVVQDYYTNDDYDNVMEKLPEIMREAELKSANSLEPKLSEKREIMKFIRQFIREKGRKVYGGTAINDLIKAKNQDDGIYDEDFFSDIEFYSPTPVVDLIELTNAIYKAGYKNPEGAEAQHEGTYKVFVNYAPEYCDITYVPAHIYYGIKTIVVDGINYVDPHFIWIDQLRIFNDPLTSSRLWMKTFEREYKLLNYYPLEHYDKRINIPAVPKDIYDYQQLVKKEFLLSSKIVGNVIHSGFEAYNFYIKTAQSDPDVDKMARVADKNINFNALLANVPFIDIVATEYRDTVLKLYAFLKENVESPDALTTKEYFPLFQFRGYSIMFLYNDVPIIRVIDSNNMCIPNFYLKSGAKMCTFQYILMSMLINKFKAHLDKDKEMYFNYAIAISNLIKVRNYYLNSKNLTVVDKSPFAQFKISCSGKSMSFERQARLRRQKRIDAGKMIVFRYKPEDFFKKSEAEQAAFDPTKFIFPNTSGNIIIKETNLRFPTFDEDSFNDEDSVYDEEPVE